MEHLLLRSKCYIFHSSLKNPTFQRRPKALVWSKGLRYILHKLILIVYINMENPNPAGCLMMVCSLQHKWVKRRLQRFRS